MNMHKPNNCHPLHHHYGERVGLVISQGPLPWRCLLYNLQGLGPQPWYLPHAPNVWLAITCYLPARVPRPLHWPIHQGYNAWCIINPKPLALPNLQGAILPHALNYTRPDPCPIAITIQASNHQGAWMSQPLANFKFLLEADWHFSMKGVYVGLTSSR